MSIDLGKWAVIDIETTGAEPGIDEVIDVGFLQFEGTKLIRTYNSLVKYHGDLSYFIQKLTNITPSMLKDAPAWGQVENEIQTLYGHQLIAHNSDFEKGFLERSFKIIADETPREEFQDSMYFLALLFPQFDSLKLEKFITGWGIAQFEEHRGLQDSVDLLKVLLLAVGLSKRDKIHDINTQHLFKKYQLQDYWFYKFFKLQEHELHEIAEQIDFDLNEAIQTAQELIQLQADQSDQWSKDFALEFTGENIKNIYRDQQQMESKFAGFQYRQSQEELSLRVGQAFKNHVHALVQAPTGTGKTLGYLLPSALYALEEKKQVLVATGTKTLQQQAMNKDVPQLRKLLGLGQEELKISRLVGSSNHLCELMFRQQDREQDLLNQLESFEDKFTAMYFDQVFAYNARVEIDKKILRPSLPYVFKRKLKEFKDKDQEVAVDFRACTGNSCPFKNECSYLGGLREARDAHIIVGNHALMFSWPKGFPRPLNVIVDEAHKIEHEATQACTLEATGGMFDSLLKNLQHSNGLGSLFYLLAQFEVNEGDATSQIANIRTKAMQVQQMLQDHLVGLDEKIEIYFKKQPRFTDLYWNEQPMISPRRANEALAVSIYNHFESLKHILTDFYEYLIPYASRWETKDLQDENQAMAFTRFEAFVAQVEDLQAALDCAISEKEGYAHSLHFHAQEGYAISSAPIDVGRVLHDGLLQTSASVVFTSATLGNGNGSQGARGIEWATGYAYLTPERRFKQGFYLPAVYDYKNKTKVFLCDDTLPFYDNMFVQVTLKPIIKLIRNLKGRSLLLFSARTRFEQARELLLKEFEGEIPVFVQGMGPDVVEEFKQKGEGILLGMESFGEGIDVPGDSLQFVFIDKVPDMRMDLVVQDRRNFYESHLGNEFTDYYLAYRTRSLQQKLGRLLRTESDFGGVIIVDSRVKKWKGRTMEKLFRLMEPYQLHRTGLDEACDQVSSFILGSHESESEASLNL